MNTAKNRANIYAKKPPIYPKNIGRRQQKRLVYIRAPRPPRIPINARGGCAARTPLVSKPKKTRFAKGKKVKRLKIKASWRGGNR